MSSRLDQLKLRSLREPDWHSALELVQSHAMGERSWAEALLCRITERIPPYSQVYATLGDRQAQTLE